MHGSNRNLRNSPRSRRLRTRRRRLASRHRLLETIREDLANAGLALTAAGLVLTHLCLARIGPPPVIRIDALWVLANESAVKAAAWGVFLAVIGSVLPVLLGRRRVGVMAIWVVAATAAAKLFSDRLQIIASVLLDQVAR